MKLKRISRLDKSSEPKDVRTAHYLPILSVLTNTTCSVFSDYHVRAGPGRGPGLRLDRWPHLLVGLPAQYGRGGQREWNRSHHFAQRKHHAAQGHDAGPEPGVR